MRLPSPILACWGGFAAVFLVLTDHSCRHIVGFPDPLPTDFIDSTIPVMVVTSTITYGQVRTMQLQFGPDVPITTIPTGVVTFSQDGDDTHMSDHAGEPGQSPSGSNKLTNDMDGASQDIGPQPVTAEHYWKMLQNPGEKIKYPFYKEAVESPDLMTVDEENMPGNWDVTNLHLHGLDVEVHMFDPVGTHNPKAPHIAVAPGQCYCYRFQIPEHHPDGLYWYHPHLHGSSAVQLWGGLMGLIYVEGNLERELKEYNIHNSQEFVLWDPAFQDIRNQKPHAEHDIQVDEFLLGQTTLSKIHPFLVNGQITPNYNVAVNEVLHLRALCGTIENENTFIVYKQGEHEQHWEEAAIPFWIVASDGVTYSKPKQRKIIVMAGGQREELLLQFDEPGTYVISQQGIQGMQFFDIICRIFHGYKSESSTLPQYYINGNSFDSERIVLSAEPNTAVEYLLINDKHNVHPFHIHVNRFQVKEMGSELSVEKYPVLKELLDFDENVWRDTVVVPPMGRARIFVQFKEYTGKTVFHCHFLAHEDTGMMGTLFIGPPDEIFEWRDHIPLMIGIGIGILAGMALMLVGIKLFRAESEQSMKEYYYSVVTMNEIKSKTLD
ncbi:cupredoxin [Nitzschia inconspicua]|uniref:Cupredoxin n=1 Tax=Nitzschia inconspicua TaxID=303405 RepID=A0A9K3KQH7_9STRA|nr:cupredoxin [Nitzschia inconspicua]